MTDNMYVIITEACVHVQLTYQLKLFTITVGDLDVSPATFQSLWQDFIDRVESMQITDNELWDIWQKSWVLDGGVTLITSLIEKGFPVGERPN